MRFLCRCGALGALLVAATFAVGCGDTVIDDVKTEEAIQHNLQKEVGSDVKSVDCPEDVSVEPKASFDCTVTLAGGQRETAELRIINEDADVELVRLSPDK